MSNYRPKSNEKTILDAIREYNYLKPKPTKNPSIPKGGSIPVPKPPQFKTYYTICDNGGRKIPAYYLGGRRVNALGFGLSKTDIKQIDKNKCYGCNSFRCQGKKWASVSTDQPEVRRKTRNCPTDMTYPIASPYFNGPYPPAPISVKISDKEYGQLENVYYH